MTIASDPSKSHPTAELCPRSSRTSTAITAAHPNPSDPSLLPALTAPSSPTLAIHYAPRAGAFPIAAPP